LLPIEPNKGGETLMLFNVRILVRLPHDIPAERLEELRAREFEAGRAFQKQGKVLHMWRIAGRYGNVVIFDVADTDELHKILTSMPLFPFMDIEVMPLVRHPTQGGPADSMTPER
jgi:muconolactone D-isomerase